MRKILFLLLVSLLVPLGCSDDDASSESSVASSESSVASSESSVASSESSVASSESSVASSESSVASSESSVASSESSVASSESSVASSESSVASSESSVASSESSVASSESSVASSESSVASSESSVSSTPSNNTDVLSYDFRAADNSGLGSDVTGSIYILRLKIPAGNTISLQVPAGVDLTSLVASFTLADGATAVINGVTQVSGTTANNYSSLLIMTVTAQDGVSTADYRISVSQDQPAPMM